MDAVTHVAAGVAIARFIPAPSRKWSILAGAGYALLPDIDFLFILVDRLLYIRFHRGFTHSLVALALFAVLGALLGRRLGGPRWFRPLLLLGPAVLASHLLLDVATSYGTQILSPFSHEKFALDWLFIIDPVFTLLLLAGAVGGWLASVRGRLLAATFLSLAGAYFLLCGLYHHQALTLARQVLVGKDAEVVRVAALPQPLSPLRWHLLAATPTEVRQTMVQLPRLAFLGISDRGKVTEIASIPGPNPHPPPLPYRPPQSLLVQTWKVNRPPLTVYGSDTVRMLETFRDFARFPLLFYGEWREGELSLQLLDLRFAIPGQAFPFVLEMVVTEEGQLRDWQWGRRSLWRR
jgi:inner membrane protein